MSSASIYEPDKYLSAFQALFIMVATVFPFVINFSLDRTLTIAQPLEVAIIAAPPEIITPPVEVEQIKQELEQSIQRQQQQAELARRKERELEEQRLREEELRQQEEAKRLEEQRLQEEAEQRRKEEEARLLAEAERRRLEEQRLQAEQKRLEEAERIEAERERREEQRKAQELARQAELKAAANAKIMNRYISGIHNQVQRHLSNPEGVPTGIQVEIRLSVGDDGHLVATPQTLKSSGHRPFDEQALRAILRSAEEGFDLPDDPDLRAEFSELILIIKPKVK